LKTLSKKVREILDRAGLSQVKILASGNLNEYKIAGLIRGQAPIDLFGVGTDMATSRDYPAMDLTYKLAQIKDAKGNIQYKAKYSPQKTTVPGRKQVFRRYDKNGFIEDDIIGLSGEDNPSKTQPLLRPVIRQGVLVEPLPVLEETRRNIQKRLAGFPPSLLRLDAGVSLIPGYTERISKMTKANALMKKG
jgi:nicotinate phosphoribosyltransferase